MSITFTHCLQNFCPSLKNLYRVRLLPFFVFQCFDSSEPPYKRTPKSSMTIVKFIHFVAQHKALYIDPRTLSSQKLVVFFLICGSNIASFNLSRWHPEVNFESSVIIPLILNKEAQLSVLYILGLDGPNISFLFLFFFFLRNESTTKSSSMLKENLYRFAD